MLSPQFPASDIVSFRCMLVSRNPTVFRRGSASRPPSPSIAELYSGPLSWSRLKDSFTPTCLPFLDGLGSSKVIFLSSSLVFVIERPKPARAECAAMVPLRFSLAGVSKRDLNFSTLSSRSLTCKSAVSSISCYFCRSIYSSLCSFCSSSSFCRSSISSS